MAKHTFLPRTRPALRLTSLAIGLALYGLGIAFLLEAGLGVDPWDVLHQGIAEKMGFSFGSIVNGVAILVLFIWIPLRQKPGLGTIANAIVVGIAADASLRLLGTPDSVAIQVGFLAFGIIAIGVATGLYIGARLGPGPRDGLMTGLANRTGRSIRFVRTAIEFSVLVVGWLLGGPVGIGTAVFALTIGPLTQVAMERLEISLPDRPQGN